MARVFNLRHSIFKGDKFAHFHQQVTIRAGIKRARCWRVDKIIRATSLLGAFIRGVVIWENVRSFDTFSRKGQLRETLSSYLSLATSDS